MACELYLNVNLIVSCVLIYKIFFPFAGQKVEYIPICDHPNQLVKSFLAGGNFCLLVILLHVTVFDNYDGCAKHPDDKTPLKYKRNVHFHSLLNITLISQHHRSHF